jgi:hypothetical protein
MAFYRSGEMGVCKEEKCDALPAVISSTAGDPYSLFLLLAIHSLTCLISLPFIADKGSGLALALRRELLRELRRESTAPYILANLHHIETSPSANAFGTLSKASPDVEMTLQLSFSETECTLVNIVRDLYRRIYPPVPK